MITVDFVLKPVYRILIGSGRQYAVIDMGIQSLLNANEWNASIAFHFLFSLGRYERTYECKIV